MKKYPPRIHDKKKRVSRADWPRSLRHTRVNEPPTVWRERKGFVGTFTFIGSMANNT